MVKSHALEAHARDLMRTDVVRLDGNLAIATAIATLEDAGISGAPVVDGFERLIGVFSLRDAARAGVLNGGRLSERSGDDRLPDLGDEEFEDGSPVEEQISDRDDYSSATAASVTVREWMNPAVIAVAPGATLKEVCRVMSREQIHRVFVVDQQRLTGVISSMDVTRYLAQIL
jgi:CBS domain-containing protein